MLTKSNMFIVPPLMIECTFDFHRVLEDFSFFLQLFRIHVVLRFF